MAGYGGFSQGFATGFGLMDAYMARKDARARNERLDAENTRRWDIQNQRQLGLADLDKQLKERQLQDYDLDQAADIYAGIRYGTDGTPVDLSRVTPAQLQDKRRQLVAVANRLPQFRAQFAANPEVDQQNPVADVSLVFDRKSKQPLAMFSLRMKDGSVKPLTAQRSSDPNDTVVGMPLGELDSSIMGVLGGRGRLKTLENRQLKATDTRSARKQELRKLDIQHRNRMTEEDAAQKNRVDLQRIKNEAGGGGLTAAQQANNAEIDEARRAITGLSRDEILRRTQEATATGRSNESYDPYLEALVRKATQRKVGDDPNFETVSQSVYGGEPPPESGGSGGKVMVPMGDGAAEVDSEAFALTNGAGNADTHMRELVQDKAAPLPGARQAPDGQWYIQRKGRWFRILE